MEGSAPGRIIAMLTDKKKSDKSARTQAAAKGCNDSRYKPALKTAPSRISTPTRTGPVNTKSSGVHVPHHDSTSSRQTQRLAMMSEAEEKAALKWLLEDDIPAVDRKTTTKVSENKPLIKTSKAHDEPWKGYINDVANSRKDTNHPSNQVMEQLQGQVAFLKQICEELSAERDALLAERTATVAQVQLLSSTVNNEPEDDDDDVESEKDADPNSTYTRRQGSYAASYLTRRKENHKDRGAAQKEATMKDAQIRLHSHMQHLPSDSEVRILLDTSRLQSCLQELQSHMKAQDVSWSHQVAAQQEELDLLRQEVRSRKQEMLEMEEAMGVMKLSAESCSCELRAARQELDAVEDRAAVQRRELQDQRDVVHAKYMASQQECVRLQSDLDRLQHVLEETTAAHLRRIEEQAASHQEIFNSMHEQHQEQVASLQGHMQEAAGHNTAMMQKLHEQVDSLTKLNLQAAELNDRQAQQIARLEDKRTQLQGAVEEAEKQLLVLRADLIRLSSQTGAYAAGAAAADVEKIAPSSLRMNRSPQPVPTYGVVSQTAYQSLRPEGDPRRDPVHGISALNLPKSQHVHGNYVEDRGLYDVADGPEANTFQRVDKDDEVRLSPRDLLDEDARYNIIHDIARKYGLLKPSRRSVPTALGSTRTRVLQPATQQPKKPAFVAATRPGVLYKPAKEATSPILKWKDTRRTGMLRSSMGDYESGLSYSVHEVFPVGR